MSKKQFTYDYPRPCVTVDVVVVTRSKPLRVLLIRRKQSPYQGAWALPGGFINMDETLEESARRELLEETGVRVGKLVQLATFGDPNRDPRHRTISVVYLTRVKADQINPRAADDAAAVDWFPLHRLPELAFDHRAILACARSHFRRTKKRR